MIRAIITESEMHSLNRLKKMLKSFPKIQIIGEAFDGEEAVSIIEGLKPDLLFLNLQLPVLDGPGVLRAMTYYPSIIFTTGYNHNIIKVFEKKSFDYLLKPFSRERFEKIVRRALQQNQRFNNRQVDILQEAIQRGAYLNHFPVKRGNKTMLIPVEKAFFIGEINFHVYLHTYDNRFLCDISLRDLENLLDTERFCRINKTHIVALSQVKKFRRNIYKRHRVVLNNRLETTLIVDKNYLSGFQEKLKSNFISSDFP